MQSVRKISLLLVLVLALSLGVAASVWAQNQEQRYLPYTLH